MEQELFQNIELRKPASSRRNTYPAQTDLNEGALYRGDVIDLLRAAHNMIGKAEEKIAAQDARIRELESLLTLDELTGLHNRRGFNEAFSREIDRAARRPSDRGLVIMIDLDRFKPVNDTYGHLAGDACLRAVGDFLKREVRDMDTAARLGGDEFVLLFPLASCDTAQRRALDMEERFNQLSIEWNGHTISIGGSFGLKDFGQGDKAEDILDEADKALYAKKRCRKEEDFITSRA